jgi:hypothetical protein
MNQRIIQSDTETLRIFLPLPPEEITRLARLQQASAKLRETIEAGTAELERARAASPYTEAAPKFRHAERLLTLFGGIALFLFVVVAGFGDSMTFDTACDLCVIMVSAAFTALVMLALIVVDDCRARRARRARRGNKEGGAL